MMHRQQPHRTFSIGDSIEVTPREIAFGVALLLLLIGLGFYFAGLVSNSVQESNEVYYTSLKIDNNQSQMEYALQTDVGNALVYGEVKAETPVTFPDLLSEYMYVEKVRERYTRHTRTYTTTDSKGHTQTHTEIYYTWDYNGSWNDCSKTFEFLGGKYPINKIRLPSADMIRLTNNIKPELESLISDSYLYPNGRGWFSFEGEIRYYYKGIPKSFMATLFVNIKDDTLLEYKAIARKRSICKIFQKLWL
jgi:hypothetical protein